MVTGSYIRRKRAKMELGRDRPSGNSMSWMTLKKNRRVMRIRPRMPTRTRTLSSKTTHSPLALTLVLSPVQEPPKSL
jgi:hypothetical protein